MKRIAWFAFGAWLVAGCSSAPLASMGPDGLATDAAAAADATDARTVPDAVSVDVASADVAAEPRAMVDASHDAGSPEITSPVPEASVDATAPRDGTADVGVDACPNHKTLAQACGYWNCGSAPDGCGGFYSCGSCDVAHECGGGLCAFKQECDCNRNGFTCGRLPDIYANGPQAPCPVVVYCGTPDGRCTSDSEICVNPRTELPAFRVCTDGRQECNGGDPTCMAHCQIVAPPYDNPCANQPLPSCRTAYWNCGAMYDAASGQSCGLLPGPSGRIVQCGPG